MFRSVKTCPHGFDKFSFITFTNNKVWYKFVYLYFKND